jgi:hypothetical protein
MAWGKLAPRANFPHANSISLGGPDAMVDAIADDGW